MTNEERDAARAALERLKRFARGEILALVYPEPSAIGKIDELRKDTALVLGALRRRGE